MKICIIIPMHNEEAIAMVSLKTIISYVAQLPLVVKILVVNDGSTDKTMEIVSSLIRDFGEDVLTMVTHQKNQGYGAALKTGIGFAINNNFDYALFMDSDLTNHPQYLKDFHTKMVEGWDYIKATRYAAGGKVEGVPFFRKIISFMGNSLARILYGLPLTDLTNGFRAVKVDILKKMDLKETGFPVIMEELYRAKSLTSSFCEIPYTLTSRNENQSVTHFSYDIATCLRYLKYALKSFLIIRH